MPDDPLREIEAKAQKAFKAFDAKRNKLAVTYWAASTPKAQLRALAKIVRQHGKFMNQNMFTGGWMANDVVSFALVIEEIAKGMKE